MTFPTRMLYDAEHFKAGFRGFDRRENPLRTTAPALWPKERKVLRRFGLDVMPLTGRTDVYEGAALLVHGEPYIVRRIDFDRSLITLARSRACRKHLLTVTPERLADLLTAEETRHAAA